MDPQIDFGQMQEHVLQVIRGFGPIGQGIEERDKKFVSEPVVIIRIGHHEPDRHPGLGAFLVDAVPVRGGHYPAVRGVLDEPHSELVELVGQHPPT